LSALTSDYKGRLEDAASSELHELGTNVHASALSRNVMSRAQAAIW